MQTVGELREERLREIFEVAGRDTGRRAAGSLENWLLFVEKGDIKRNINKEPTN